MSTPTYLWHDYETFGANPRYDRPAQFAAIRTDPDLNPLEEPIEEYCHPGFDTLPHPQACLLTGITPQMAESRGWPEPEFIRRVLAQLGRPGSCGVGYNSLRFDDELTRHTAWRNFHDPYAREWRNGCSRWDIIDMVRMTYALRPQGIEWPRRADGQPSFRLEDLAAANDLEQAQAHDALSDVRATIALARLIRTRQPRLYDFVVQHRDKKSAGGLLNLQTHEPVVHVSSRFPAEYGCLSLVMPVVAHPVNRNAVLVCDLRQDPGSWLDLPPEDIAERLFTPRADLPEDVERVAVKAVHLNRCPILAPVNTVSESQAERLDLDLARCRQHWKGLHQRIDDIAAKLSQVFAEAEFGAPGDPEQDLYGGFISDADRRLCDRIPDLSAGEFDGLELPFEDRRLHELLFRYRARHYPESLNEAERDEWSRLRSRRLEFAADGGLDLPSYFAMLDELKVPAERLPIIESLRDWGRRLQDSL